MDAKNLKQAVSETPTPYAVNCRRCGFVHMSQEFYMAQMRAAFSKWLCPICFEEASWSDENYEAAMGVDDGEDFDDEESGT
jgi:hypothetical protein